MSDAPEGLGPLADRKLSDKELSLVGKMIDLMVEASDDVDAEDVKEIKDILVEQIDNIIYNATRLKELIQEK